VAHGYSTINITELDTNFVAKSTDAIVFIGDIRSGLEGSHVYKKNGYYYLYCTYGGGDGFQVALRSKNIYGPYEEKIVVRDNSYLGTGLHQGALIETQTGEWWTIIFQDGGAFGRFPSLQPVTWQDDWPMVGVNGKGVVTYTKPNVGKVYPMTVLPTSDEFDSTKLGMQWGWNHNPDSTKWSLTQNPGSLRLSTVKVVSKFIDASNTLTQRIFAFHSGLRTTATTATVKIEIDNMYNGDVAGLAVFQNPYAFIGIKKSNGVMYVIMINNGNPVDSAVVIASTIYLRASAYYSTSRTSLFYSLDNQSFTKLGNDLSMQFNLSIFTGNKFCLFNYATIATGGYVDIDWFRIGMPAQTGVTPVKDHSDNDLPQSLLLRQNYPNPFNPSTIITYTVPVESFVTLKVFDSLGREVSKVFSEEMHPGTYSRQWNAEGLPSGAYFYRFVANAITVGQAGSYFETKKLIIIR
jgi:beta-xylosidase